MTAPAGSPTPAAPGGALDAVSFARMLGDSTRLRALSLMLAEGELCVCELVWAMRLVQPKISRHLALLREAGIVDDRRDGTWVHYRVAASLPGWARRALESLQDGVQGRAPYADDHARLLRMPDRPGSRCG